LRVRRWAMHGGTARDAPHCRAGERALSLCAHRRM